MQCCWHTKIPAFLLAPSHQMIHFLGIRFGSFQSMGLPQNHPSHWAIVIPYGSSCTFWKEVGLGYNLLLNLEAYISTFSDSGHGSIGIVIKKIKTTNGTLGIPQLNRSAGHCFTGREQQPREFRREFQRWESESAEFRGGWDKFYPFYPYRKITWVCLRWFFIFLMENPPFGESIVNIFPHLPGEGC